MKCYVSVNRTCYQSQYYTVEVEDESEAEEAAIEEAENDDWGSMSNGSEYFKAYFIYKLN